MNKIFKTIAITGNVSEVIIASTMLTELIGKLRGYKKATTIRVGENPAPQTPKAA